MIGLPDTLRQPIGIGWAAGIMVLLAAASGGVAWGVAQSRIAHLEQRTSDRLDWIEKQLTAEMADQKSMISGLMATVDAMQEQQEGISKLWWQISDIQQDLSEIKDALGLRLRPSRGPP